MGVLLRLLSTTVAAEKPSDGPIYATLASDEEETCKRHKIRHTIRMPIIGIGSAWPHVHGLKEPHKIALLRVRGVP